LGGNGQPEVFRYPRRGISLIVRDANRIIGASLTDLNMLVLLTGRGRTLPEYRGSLKDAGLRFSESAPIRWQMAVIEAEAP
jgi:hypothetical protein